MSEAFFPSWQYTPFLIISVVFSCFSSYYASFYMASKKNIMAMVTVFLGALMNVILNYWLIPIYGLQGAAFATAVSYVFIFLFRAVDTRRMVKIDLDIPTLLLNSALLGVQAACCCMMCSGWPCGSSWPCWPCSW